MLSDIMSADLPDDLGFVLLIVDDRAAEVEIAYRSDLDDDEAAEVLDRTIGMLRGEGTTTDVEVVS